VDDAVVRAMIRARLEAGESLTCVIAYIPYIGGYMGGDSVAVSSFTHTVREAHQHLPLLVSAFSASRRCALLRQHLIRAHHLVVLMFEDVAVPHI
jgi:hypothetical protein